MGSDTPCGMVFVVISDLFIQEILNLYKFIWKGWTNTEFKDNQEPVKTVWVWCNLMFPAPAQNENN